MREQRGMVWEIDSVHRPFLRGADHTRLDRGLLKAALTLVGWFGVFMYASTCYHGYTWLNPNPAHRALRVEMLLGLVPARPHLASLLFSKRRACPLAPEWFRFLQ